MENTIHFPENGPFARKSKIVFSNNRINAFREADAGGREIFLVCEGRLIGQRHLTGFPDGIIRFAMPADLKGIHLWIEADHGQWLAACSGFTWIERKGASNVQKEALPQRGIIRFVAGPKTVDLYICPSSDNEPIPQNYSLFGIRQLKIGRSAEADLILKSPLASRSHAMIEQREGRFKILDTGSSFGTKLNGRKVVSEYLNLGDVIEFPGARVIIGLGFISIVGNEALYETRGPLRISPAAADSLRAEPPFLKPEPLFFRKPRTRSFHFEPEVIQIDSPPMSMSGEKIPLALRLGGPAVFSSASAMAGNYTSMISSVLFPVLTSKYTEKQRQEYESRRTRLYTAYLNQKAAEIQNVRFLELKDLKENNPDAEELSEILKRKHRMWERRPLDADFLKLRIGSGPQPLKSELSYPKKSFGMDEDVLMRYMFQLAEQDYSLENAPAAIDFFENFICGFRGSIEDRIEMFLSLLFKLSYLHSPEEVRVVILAEPEMLDRFPAVRYLPHVWEEDRSCRFIATTPAECSQISSRFSELVEFAADRKPDRKHVLENPPYYFVFSFSQALLSSVSALDTVLKSDTNLGFTILSFSDFLPSTCIELFDLNGEESKAIQLRHQEKPDIPFTPDLFDADRIQSGLLEISNLKMAEQEEQGVLPAMLTFLEMFGVGKIEHLSIMKRWKESNPMKSLAAPVGVNPDGTLFYLDLHERHHGPHGLIAGMTGSGKSEFIITYILSMAVNYHPDEVSFILIDFKGGGLTGAFEDESNGIRLPHLAGTITNLDESTMSRALASIESELKRRQKIFNEAKSAVNEGTMDIYSYQQLYRSGKVSEPVSHLFIISDEFAELKSQQPEFMDQLISTARIGRSLGVHLILATQKPSGVVNEQIWSNSRFKVCLKVQDRSDSTEMIKRPEAAEIKETGRFYLQVGYNEYFALGQSAWTGAKYEPSDEVVRKPDNEILFVDPTGQPVFRTKPAEKKDRRDYPQLVEIMKFLTDVSQSQGIASRPLWLDPLPARIDLDEISQPKGKYAFSIGMTDDPSSQRQDPLVLDLAEAKNILVCGDSGSGKSQLIQTILLALARKHSPDDLSLYMLDFPGKSLGSFKELRHAGAAFLRPAGDQVKRVIDKILSVLDERKTMFIQLRQSRFEAVQKMNGIPRVMLVLDGFDELPDDNTGRQVQENLVTIAREGPAYGITILLGASSQKSMIMKLRSEFSTALPLHLKESYQYFDLLGRRPEFTPENRPGRGLSCIGKKVLEFQTALLQANGSESERLLAVDQEIERLNRLYQGSRKPEMVAVLDRKMTYQDFIRGFRPERIPVGILSDTVKPIALPFQQLFLLSAYFGSPEAVLHFKEAWYLAAGMNKALKAEFGKKKPADPAAAAYPATEKGIRDLMDWLNFEVQERTRIRKEICREMEIEDWKDPDNRKAWRKEMRKRTRSAFLMIDSLADLVISLNDEQAGFLQAVFEMADGYNIYIAACLYPGDRKKIQAAEEEFEKKPGREASPMEINDRLKKHFSESPGLLFGGRFNDQPMFSLSMEYARMSSVFEPKDQNQALLIAGGRTGKLLFPMGDLEVSRAEDEDDLPIL